MKMLLAEHEVHDLPIGLFKGIVLEFADVDERRAIISCRAVLLALTAWAIK